MNGIGFFSEEYSINSGKKGVKRWAKSENGRVTTSQGLTVDFVTNNFSAKHLVIVTNATPFNTLLAMGKQRQIDRTAGTIPGMKASTSTILVMTVGQLAAWGADIVENKKAIGEANCSFQGTPQWEIITSLKSAVFITHKNKLAEPLSSGIGATVVVTCFMSGGTLSVAHFVPTKTGLTDFGGDVGKGGGMRAITTSGNTMIKNDINKKRDERFQYMTRQDDDDFDLGQLFGN
ncbi:hypothetical protein [Acidiphilium acidophilum]|uniref:Uncharacterized protein n=1 Tax=Acidiphilium acidophilum TaxID=76588 RepID=A0AAW9DSY4_ACIAO|nr:hypothetical protein [Acidiphilium acidophilum]MDX5932173.1 hypothetical protein [Acidiphilium acidophilum]